MNKNFGLKNCSHNNAVSFSSGTYTVQEITEALQQEFKGLLAQNLCERLKKHNVNIDPVNARHSYTYANWFTQGIDCEILKPGAEDWQKGKVRLQVTLEFIPDEIEDSDSKSTLDDIRQTITKE